MNRTILVVGIVLFILYVGQEVLPVKWEYLASLQERESYKRWTGLVLFIFIAAQWMLSLFRIKKQLEPRTPAVMNLHRWMGSLAPLVFYVHSMHFGFAYLFVLSSIFFANIFLGFVHTDVVKVKAYWYFQSWMVLHVALSTVVSLLVFYHIWIVFYYN